MKIWDKFREAIAWSLGDRRRIKFCEDEWLPSGMKLLDV